MSDEEYPSEPESTEQNIQPQNMSAFSEQVFAPEDFTRSDLEFNGLAIITFWILPLFLTLFYISAPGLWFWLATLSGIFFIITKQQIPVIYPFFYHLTRITFGARFSRSDSYNIRVWWFLTFGSILVGIISYFVISMIGFIIPLILIILKRKEFLKIMYTIAVLPRRDYVKTVSDDEIDRRERILSEYSYAERQYMIFMRPRLLSRVVTYLVIIFIPFSLMTFIIPPAIILQFNVNQSLTIPVNLVDNLLSSGEQISVWGLYAVIPYIVLFLPIWGRFKLNRLVTTKLAGNIIQLLTGAGSNVPNFSGDYYLEEESQLVDMSSITSFTEIFKRGRLTTIILTPLALISLVFNWTVLNVELSGDEEGLQIGAFLGGFNEAVRANQLLIFAVMIAIPIVLTILLPLVFVLSDTEIKRSQWRSFDETMNKTPEILSVEDIGRTVNNLFKLVLGIGSITSISSSVGALLSTDSSINVYAIAAIVLIFGAALIFPGTIYMVYLHFASGDHVKSVNYLRYQASLSNKIGVGTVNGTYQIERKLEDVPELTSGYMTTPTKPLNNSDN